MNSLKQQALIKLNELFNELNIPYGAYSLIHDVITDIESLKDRDCDLEEIWKLFADIPINLETECIEEDFLIWKKGVHREEIWHWFDERHSKGVHYLLYGDDCDHEQKKCFVVEHSNYCEGSDAYVMWDHKKAQQSIEDDVRTTTKSLIEQGYSPEETRDALGCIELYVPDTDIYYD